MRGLRRGVSSLLCLLALFLLLGAYMDMLTYLVNDGRAQGRRAGVQRAKQGVQAQRASKQSVDQTGDPLNDVILKEIPTNDQGNQNKNLRNGSLNEEAKETDGEFQEMLQQYLKEPYKQKIPNNNVKPKKILAKATKKSVKLKQEVPKEEDDPSYIIHRKFTESQNSTIFFLGAVGKNSTPSARWDKFAVYGQWYNHDDLKVWSLRCCFKYADGTLIEKKVAEFFAKVYYKPGGQNVNRGKLRLWHSTCDNPEKGPFPVPHWISIARNRSCNSPDVSYIQPYLTMKRAPGHLTITTKMAYAKIKPETVISYLESARILGIDKVLTYVLDNLDPVVDRVLRHYASTGILDYYKLELADLKRMPRSYPPLGPQYMNDEWLVMRDSIERNMGSEFFGIFDMDEYLVPSGNRTIKEMLRSLQNRFPNASHFFFTNIHYLTEYEFNDPECWPNCTQFRRHIKTAPRKFDYNSIHEKMILQTSRVETASIRNHYITSLKGYGVQQCPPEEGYVRHYGSCLRKFTERVCTHPFKWIEDRSMVEWARTKVDDKITNALKTLVV